MDTMGKKLKVTGADGIRRTVLEEILRRDGLAILLTDTKDKGKPSFELGRWRVRFDGYDPTEQRLALSERELARVQRFFAEREGGPMDFKRLKRERQKMFFAFAN